MKTASYVLLGLAGAFAGLFSIEIIPMLAVAMLAFIGGNLVGVGTALKAIYKLLEEDNE